MFIEDLDLLRVLHEKNNLYSQFCKQRKMASVPAEQVAQLHWEEMDLSKNQFVVVGAGQVQKQG